MASKTILIGIITSVFVSVFLAGLGVGYLLFYSDTTTVPTMTAQQMTQMMNDPDMQQQMMNMMNNQNMMGNMTGMMDSGMQGMMDKDMMMQDPETKEKMIQIMSKHIEEMQNLLSSELTDDEFNSQMMGLMQSHMKEMQEMMPNDSMPQSMK